MLLPHRNRACRSLDILRFQAVREHIRQGRFTSAGFAEGRYKEFFLIRVRLADNAVEVLVEADITNSTCNTNWTLDFNTNGGVHRGPFTCWIGQTTNSHA